MVIGEINFIILKYEVIDRNGLMDLWPVEVTVIVDINAYYYYYIRKK